MREVLLSINAELQDTILERSLRLLTHPPKLKIAIMELKALWWQIFS